MPAVFVTPLSIDPPLIGVAVHPARHTHDMIKFSEEFALNFPSRSLLNHVQYYGTVSGRELDKLDISKLPTFKARKIGAPLLEGCVAFIECGLEDALRIGDHTLFIGRVVAVTADEEAFNENWLLTDEDEKPSQLCQAYYYLALLRATGGDRAGARSLFQKALEQATRDVEAKFAAEELRALDRR